ncbi:hypothetical protein E4U13_001000 [Claviceps humidiphila]|uniref:Beta-lactamase-related domain-containing protein n=1 Tax=Claviceps humidiphila TaxID=1294629 RepID=A0A9P7Q4A3_9HYPO|nr:hypothetical protein E4U13_001000 [Claviceps humidiphila]
MRSSHSGTESFQSYLKACFDEGIASSLVLIAKRRDGSDVLDTYMGGPSRALPSQCPIDDQTIFTLASCTKLPTTVAALQLVDKKLITIDEDVSQLLPVLGRQKILVGWQADGSPILRERRNPITLRQLLTHSSGCGYDFYHPDLKRFRRYQGTTPATKKAKVTEWFDQPLVFEPGQGWEYGAGLDWVGKLIEQISGMSLEDYMSRYVWAPLGASSYTFWPDAPGYTRELATLAKRDRATGKLDVSLEGLDLNRNVKECFGGHGAYCSAADYAELMFSLLANDERVLRPSSVELMFENQLSAESKEALQEVMRTRDLAGGDYYAGEVYSWGLGGLLVEETHDSEAPYDRGAKTLAWCSALNHYWFIDRSKGVCGLLMTHVVPSPDAQIKPLIRAFLQHTYRENARPAFPSFL